MNTNEFPKVLVVSTNAWRDNTGINTLINFFKCWDRKQIGQIYTKSALPNTTICEKFFCISENAVMQSVISREITTGREVKNEDEQIHNVEAERERNMYSSYTGRIRRILALCREIVWKLGKWKSAELDCFIDEFNADVLFIPIYPTIYMGRIQKYIIERTKRPVVAYLADDNYSFKSVGKTPIALFERCILRKYVKYIVEHSAKLLVIAPNQQEEYKRVFGVDSEVLTKGVDFEPFKEYKVGSPIKLVYTGKLIIGRWKSLAAVANALGEINKNKIKAELDIYTTDTLTDKQKKALNKNGCSVKGPLPLNMVIEVQKRADILVFVESLEKKYKKKARLSFSTKITDYLKSGKCIFAIGYQDIAPIDYFNRYDSAVTASSYKEIKTQLIKLINQPEMIKAYAHKAYACGKEHHERDKMNTLLKETIIDAMKNK